MKEIKIQGGRVHNPLEQVFNMVKVTHGYMKLLHKRFKEYFSMPFSQLPEEVKNEVVYGHYENYSLNRIFQGRYEKGEDLNGIYTMTTYSDCHGFRVGEEARRVFLKGGIYKWKETTGQL